MIVVDVSVAAKWFLVEPDAQYAKSALRLVERDGAVVPALFIWEMQSALVSAERRQRITTGEVEEAFNFLESLPISIETIELGAGNNLSLVRHYNLTPYDASYLITSLHYRSLLATEDRELRAAAADLGVLYELK